MESKSRKNNREIPPFKLIPQPLNQQAKDLPKFKYAEPEIGTRHKLGGKPEFIQKDDIPKCQDCKEEMTFYAQLDSINDDINIADCGLIYVFICFDCYEVKSLIHSY